MTTTEQNIVIIGAGHAGVAAAFALRKAGYEGAVTLFGDEPEVPYERPPLSKAWLTAQENTSKLLATEERFELQNVVFRSGVKVVSIDRAAKQVMLSSGETCAYDKLIIATGSQARRLPLTNIDGPGVHVLRTAEDARALRADMGSAKHLVAIGAGYIGLEVAASGRKLGLDVTVVEMAPRCMMRTGSEQLSSFYEAYHKQQGVNFIFGAGVTGIVRDEANKVVGVMLTDGRELACDVVLLAAGGTPVQGLAEDAGVVCADGIIVDEDARTSDPDIYAIGDCTARESVFLPGRMRLESVHNAIEQAALTAASIMGQPRPRLDAPWFWSDQYDLKLQIAGIVLPDTEKVVRADPATNALSVFHFKGDEFVAVEAVNATRSYMVGRKVLTEGKTLNRAIVEDPEGDLMKAIV